MKAPHDRFAWTRAWAVFLKEMHQTLRDKVTFGLAVGVPIMQLVLFGFAINTDPKQLPTVLVVADASPLARQFAAAVGNTGYFRIVATTTSEREADAMLQDGRAQFLIAVPPGFERALVRGERAPVLVAVDATDPAATGGALAALQTLAPTVIARDAPGALADTLAPPHAAIDLRVHRRYNPEGLSRYNIVPGLIGTILTMTMVMLTALGMTRERERGTLENLLATPVRPLEVMIGKIAPYVVVGYVQLTVILAAARWIFGVPMEGSLLVLMAAIGVFMLANLAVGFTFSTLARTQLQALEMTFFFFLPSLLLSGFMFPFRGMPGWAQTIGEILPLTHFLRIVRGILLKGNTAAQVLPEVWPMLAFLVVAGIAALARYRQTVD